MTGRDLEVRAPPVVVDASDVLAWDFAWRLPDDQGGFVVTCKHRHWRPVDASTCVAREAVAGNGLDWRPLGIVPALD